MRYINQSTVRTHNVPKWRMTDEGFLRCTARIQQEKILQYTLEELGNVPEGFIKDPADVFVSREALADPKALKSLEGMPVVAWNHTWMDPSIIKASIGSVAGAPKIDGEFLICDLLITNTETIEQIKSGKIGEISAAYSAENVFEEGEFAGNMFDARQEDLHYNHIAIIPVGKGRAGIDVRITNIKKENSMPDNEIKLVRVQARNSKKYMNMDEGSADVYAEEVSNMDEEISKTASDMEEMRGEIDGYKQNMSGIEELKALIQKFEGEIAAYKQQLEGQATTDQQIEAAALNMVTETREAEEMVQNMDIADDKGKTMDEKSKAKFMNSISAIHGDDLRKKILAAVGIDTKNMSSEALKGAWSVRKQMMNTTKLKKVVGQKMFNQQLEDTHTPVGRSARARLGIK